MSSRANPLNPKTAQQQEEKSPLKNDSHPKKDDQSDRDERERRLQEHRARIEEIERADYAIADDKRSKAADELMWLEFETRMREVMRKVVEPAL